MNRLTIAIGLGMLIVNAPTGVASEPAKPLTQQQIVAKLVASHGIDRWSTVEAIRFTFNVERAEERVAQRTWEWEPATNKVTCTDLLAEKPTQITYERGKIKADDKALRDVDGKFINDTFWLLLPLHLSWATDVKLTDGPVTMGPLRKHIARQITVTYPGDSGGYTPGDEYKLYVDDNWRIVSWSYHKGGADEPTLATIWAQDVQVGPLTLCQRFVNSDAQFALYFTGLAVKAAPDEDAAEADADTTDDGWHSAKRVDHPCRTCP